MESIDQFQNWSMFFIIYIIFVIYINILTNSGIGQYPSIAGEKAKYSLRESCLLEGSVSIYPKLNLEGH